ncbi:hypothetical protein PRIPAC_92881 [Pristionchus pacificus]|uniref:Uncharacterized protein n=1 Tax=Pristionchus pacificus TaxID=54126 RepID=A0A2A6CH22_PRIPA|nr:hypothetical protein PRIPAC_92881 [Pristionchus pacificus]|eukprot:PDM77525.1 hypothetical protein PRIPAC_34392 [Pristionchus pacificus]
MRLLYMLAAALAISTAADPLQCRSHKKTVDHATGKESEPEGAASSEQCEPSRVCSLTVTREDKSIEISQGCAIETGQLCYFAAEEQAVTCSCKTMNCNSPKVFIIVPEREQSLSENLRKIGVTFEIGTDTFELELSARPTDAADPGAKKAAAAGGDEAPAVAPAGRVTKPPSDPAFSKSSSEDSKSGVMTSTSSLLALLCAYFFRFF